MSEQEEGVHQVSREPGGRAGEPEQGTHRGAEKSEGALHGAKELKKNKYKYKNSATSSDHTAMLLLARVWANQRREDGAKELRKKNNNNLVTKTIKKPLQLLVTTTRDYYYIISNSKKIL